MFRLIKRWHARLLAATQADPEGASAAFLLDCLCIFGVLVAVYAVKGEYKFLVVLPVLAALVFSAALVFDQFMLWHEKHAWKGLINIGK